MGLSPSIQLTAPSFCQTPSRASVQADVRPTPYLNKVAKAYNSEPYPEVIIAAATATMAVLDEPLERLTEPYSDL